MSPRIQRNDPGSSKLYVGSNPVTRVYVGGTLVYDEVRADDTPGIAAATSLATSITKHGMTFTFDQAYPVGQYCNGDYFVVAPSGGKIVSTTPASVISNATTNESGTPIPNRVMNGMAVNPPSYRNAFDSFESFGAQSRVNANYSDAANIDPGNTGQPYDFAPGETLIKAISVETPIDTARTTVERYATLTVVDKTPVAGAFRPPVGGTFKDIPSTWREDQINWSRVPARDTSSFSASNVPWSILATRALETWQSWTLWGNGARNIVPNTMRGLYRRELGMDIGECIQALTLDASQETKRDIMIGMIQLGIDQAAGAHMINAADTNNTSLNNRWDIGRRAPTVLAATLLPDNTWLTDALSNLWRWQDTSSFGTVTQSNINRFDDDTSQGAATGMLGLPEWIASRPARISGVSASNAFDAFNTKSLTYAYRKIGLLSEITSVTAIHLFTGAASIFNSQGIVKYNDRWNNLVANGWPGIGETDSFGSPTTYQTKSTSPSKRFYDYFREIRPYLSIPELNGVAPEQPEPPRLSENGTQIIFTPTSPYVGHGASQTQMDVRYVVVSGSPLSASGTWTEVSDITLNAQGAYIISPTPTGGLQPNTTYAVGIRYHNKNGPGAWSRNWAYGTPSSTPWQTGLQETATELSPTIPTFTAQPVLESYYSVGTPATVSNTEAKGLPTPTISYQWRYNGVNIAGATKQTFVPTAGDVGKVLSVVVTASNSEGSQVETISGRTIATNTGEQTYLPKVYATTDGASQIARGSFDGASLFSEDNTRQFTTALWFTGSSAAFNSASNRTSVRLQSNGVISVDLRNFAGVREGAMNFGPANTDDLAWYLVSVNTAATNTEDIIRVFRKSAASPYPAKRLPILSTSTPVSPNATLRLARSRSPQSLLSADPDSVFSDYWHGEGVALNPEDFFDASGNPINIDRIGSPRIRIGGNMTQTDINDRMNSGSGQNSLPAADDAAVFEEIDEIAV